MTSPDTEALVKALEAWEAATATMDGKHVLINKAITAIQSLTATIAEQAKEIEGLALEKEAAEFAARNGESLSSDAIHEIRELLKAHDVPLAPFIDDHVGNAIVQRNQERARVSALSAEVERLRLPEGTLAKHGSTITIEFDGAEYAIRAFDALEYAMSGEPAALGERP